MTYLFSNSSIVVNEVEVKNDIGNAIPILGNVAVTGNVYLNNNSAIVSLTNPLPVTGNVNIPPVTGNVSLIGALQGINPDAFGRTRVSEPYTLGDYKHLYSLDPNFIDVKEFGGNVTFSANKACATLTTNSHPSSNVVHQTKFYHVYLPGKSQLILSSIHFGNAQRNVTKRTGYFDDQDGIYFEQQGGNLDDGTSKGNLHFVIRSFTNGTANESDVGTYQRRVDQNNWNIDKCDGTGKSRFYLDPSKTQLFFTDFQWLGVGRVRCGFVHNGEFIIAHEYYHSNVLPEVYLSNPNLPVRCEIRNTGTTTGGSMDQICSTVASEGGYVESGIDFALVQETARSTSTPGGTELPLIALRLKNTFGSAKNRMSVKVNSISFYAETNSILFKILRLPNASYMTYTGNVANWTSVSNSSGVEYCTNAITYADGDQLFSGFVPSGASQNSLSPVALAGVTNSKKNTIVQNIDSSNSEIYCVVIRTISTSVGASATAAAALQWREIY